MWNRGRPPQQKRVIQLPPVLVDLASQQVRTGDPFYIVPPVACL